MKKGLTLVEIIITIGVIEVVAAITIPSLVTNYQKRVTVKQLKVAYNLFSNAIEQVKVDYGAPFCQKILGLHIQQNFHNCILNRISKMFNHIEQQNLFM